MNFVPQVARSDGAAVEIVKPPSEQLKELSAVEARALRQLVDLVVLQRTDDGHRHVEIVLFLRIAIAQQSSVHQCIDVAGIAEDTNLAQVEMTGQVVVVDTARPALHADAEEHGLHVADAIAVADEPYLGRGLLHEVVAQLRVLRQFHHALDGLKQRRHGGGQLLL